MVHIPCRGGAHTLREARAACQPFGAGVRRPSRRALLSNKSFCQQFGLAEPEKWQKLLFGAGGSMMGEAHGSHEEPINITAARSPFTTPLLRNG